MNHYSTRIATISIAITLVSLGARVFGDTQPPTAAPSAPSTKPDTVAPTGHVIPLTYDRAVTPMPLVRASVAGKPAMDFLLDTGTSVPLTIEPWAAQQLGLKGEPAPPGGGDITFTPTRFTGGVALLSADGKESLQFDLDQAYIAHIGVLDTVFGDKKVAGIIGLQFLSPVTSRIDFEDRTLTIYDSTPPPPATDAVTLPLALTPDGRATVSVPLSTEKSADLPVDTGSISTVIPVDLAPALQPKATINGNMTQQIDAIYICPDFELPSLSLGAVSVPDVTVSTLPDGARAALGLNILTRFVVTIDMPDLKLELEPNPDAATGHFEEGWTGIHFGPNSTIVADIDPGSPAIKAGLKVGDEVESVDGHALADLPPQLIFHTLDGDEGTDATIDVKRIGEAKPISITFTRGSEFKAAKLPFDGLILKKPNQQAINVIGVQKGCIGDIAGVKAGDIITTIDGEPTEAMTVGQLGIALQAGRTHLTITRAGEPKAIDVDLALPDSADKA